MCGFLITNSHLSDGAFLDGMRQLQPRGTLPPRVQEFRGFRFGHVRLPLQSNAKDEDDRGVQPAVLKGGTLAMFVGEVFSPEASYSGDGPTELELLVRAARTPGHAGLHALDGFWSLAFISPSGTLQVFTDHLGIKPVYYWPEHEMVGSEILSFFSLVPRPPLDEIYLSNCIKFGYDYSGRTPWQGIYQMPPGSVLSIDPMGNLNVRPYWNWDLVSEVPEPCLISELTTATLRRAMGVYDTEDNPVPVLLSGGLDSSIVYQIMKHASCPLIPLHFENGETEYAQMLDPDVEILSPPTNLALAGVEAAVLAMQAPLDLGSLIPQVRMAEALTQEGHRVVMTGDGADEVFGGYRRAAEYDSQASDVFCELPYYHLPRLDRVLMAHTIELRSPFLAPTIVAYGLRTPWSSRTSKQILKKIAWELGVPERIIFRDKRPLKTTEVAAGGFGYRKNLVETFRYVFATS